MSMCHNEGLPSAVTNRKWLHCCSPKVAEFEPYNIGLWMMLCDDVQCDPESSMTEIDIAWTKTKDLVFSGIVPILKAKCTTKSIHPKNFQLTTGGAICSTRQISEIRMRLLLWLKQYMIMLTIRKNYFSELTMQITLQSNRL
ncbi:uncharacterized protein TNCT_549521 [Trichonephila clavata]|uniref:Uncharacterized protein n=1 Tax=Trichonephila clavata TaxID=2740835 RepID=A0A8X6LN53_TRICU|nr:uncharacterized protein TNCT_549521 [Trichonephila clavata]